MRSYPWHSLSIPEVVQHFNSNAHRGLAISMAATRLREYGKNELTKRSKETLFNRIARQLQSAIALVLIAAGIAALLLGEIVDASVIIFALFVNIVIGLVQEGRASQAFEKLAEGEESHTLVLREGKRMEIETKEVVIGDVVLLRAGKQVPADVRLIEASDLSANEASLTGEWVPVSKRVEVLPEDIAPSQRINMAFKGSTIVSGRGAGVVVATGDDTEVGKIAHELQEEKRSQTPLEKNMEQVARFILMITAFFAVIIVGLGIFRGEHITEIVLVAIALAVSAIPEGLPAAVTASLAVGMERILKFGGLVKNLLAAEILGTTTYVLTDKTGTLTKGRMALIEYALLGERVKSADAVHTQELLKAAAYASDAVLDEESGEAGAVVHGRPIERSILLSSVHAGVPPVGSKQVFSFPFSSDKRFGGAVVEDDGVQTMYVSGAPETLLSLSSKIYDGVRERDITAKDEETFARYLEEYTENGLRVIAVGRRVLTEGDLREARNHVKTVAQDLTFMGLLVFADQVREDVHEALERIVSAGARVVMVTGDNPNTALYVAREVGLGGGELRAITGTDIDRMSDTELLEALRTHYVFARVLPTQKLRIARLLRSNKEVVAMTGDGINDAPALQAATIGVAVGSGTDVAKEAADLILLNDSFAIIVKTIEEGRRMRDNIKKVVTFLLATNFSEVGLITVALLFGLPLPILPTQILWANIVGGGLMNFAFGFEPADKRTMKRNPKDPEITNILSREVIQFIMMIGAITAGLLLILYFYLLSQNVPIEEIRTILFVGISFDALLFAFSMKSLSKPLWKINIFSNPYLIGALFVSVLVLLAALFVPFFAFLLSITPLTSTEILLLVLLGVFNVFAIEVSKWLLFRSRRSA